VEDWVRAMASSVAGPLHRGRQDVPHHRAAKTKITNAPTSPPA
jgi:hypothetical protein